MPNIDIQAANDRLAAIAKKLAETKEPRKFDFSSTPSALTIGQNEGTTFANIAAPANFDKVPVGSEAKLLVKLPTNPADLPPTDDVQVAMIGTYLWIDKAATNIMNWGEVKTQLQAGKIMVITRLADVDVQGNTYQTFQLARWEDAPKTGNAGRPETIFGTHGTNQEFDIQVPFDKIISGVFQLNPPTTQQGIIFNLFTSPIVKTGATNYGAFIHEPSGEYSAMVNKKDENTITVQPLQGVKVLAWHIVYWKED